MTYVIGVDVGTGSARAGLFDETGKMYATAQAPIKIKHPQAEWAEQSSTDIWQSVCFSVRECVKQSGVASDQIKGISFSATCSLVLLDKDNKPLSLSEGDDLWNIVVWMDHRATAEAEEITSGGSPVLENLGGRMSPEMQIPKLMWLKRNRPDVWSDLAYAGDLADFLTYKSSGSLARSVCTLGCKWTYNPDTESWNKEFLKSVALEDLLEKAQLPQQASPIGTALGALTQNAAAELGLTENCQVGVGLIDAHSGALGTLGLFSEDQPERRMALIAGTSNCHIALSTARNEVPGIWGPYFGAVAPGIWANEGGQSLTGALLDHVIALFSGGKEASGDEHAELTEVLLERMKSTPDVAGRIHVKPDLLGNRSPFADAEMRGEIVGLTLEDPKETYLKVYWAAAASIAYGTKLIIDRMNEHGYAIDTLHLSGGHKKSELLVGLYSDATGCDVVISEAEEPVLLGAAIAALATQKGEEGVSGAISEIALSTTISKPDAKLAAMHRHRYQTFLDLYR
ncbi:FGGY-family carbohydrate kinase [Pseudovibrio exalbescens]|uniref:FGGY-family carbohydrate kinase n=1 Tax=Pseudovibrio exalbescens TaxID=197461 RepID=UPI0023656DCA|nr:FGGY-family carbohydrate kinase [Pseudovibrio exalbescens]MDD7909620.1 FGGY-family carbohydrate kinase [Pseudovibrio exalbescens]